LTERPKVQRRYDRMIISMRIPLPLLSYSSQEYSSWAPARYSSLVILGLVGLVLCLVFFLARTLVLSRTYKLNREAEKATVGKSEVKVESEKESDKKVRKWWPRWESFERELPVSLSLSLARFPSTSRSKGVLALSKFPTPPSVDASSQSPPPAGDVANRLRAVGPSFDSPRPAIFEATEPLSMAKAIMSRHTYRRPSFSAPPPRISSSRLLPKPITTTPEQTPFPLSPSTSEQPTVHKQSTGGEMV